MAKVSVIHVSYGPQMREIMYFDPSIDVDIADEMAEKISCDAATNNLAKTYTFPIMGNGKLRIEPIDQLEHRNDEVIAGVRLKMSWVE